MNKPEEVPINELDPEKGSTAVRFVVKGNTAIAAEGDEEFGNRQ